MKPIILVPLVALALAVGSAGAYFWLSSEGSVEEATVAQPTATPTPSPETPTPAPTAAPTPTPTPTPAAETPSATPPPAAKGGQAPGGCLDSYLAYVDPDGRFAFCYPDDMELVPVDTGAGIAANIMHPTSETNRVTAIFGLQVEPYSPCAIDSMTIVRNERIENFIIDGKSVQACFKDHYDRTQPDVLLFKTIDFMVLTQEGVPVIVFVAYSGPDFARQGVPVEEIGGRILGSAVIY